MPQKKTRNNLWRITITLLNIVSKTQEKFVFDALYSFLATLINDCQYGFRKRTSPPLQLISYLNAIYRNASDPLLKIETMYLDFAKAIDKINHRVFLYKLRQLGVWGKLLGVLRSYFSGVKAVCTSWRCEIPVYYRHKRCSIRIAYGSLVISCFCIRSTKQPHQ